MGESVSDLRVHVKSFAEMKPLMTEKKSSVIYFHFNNPTEGKKLTQRSFDLSNHDARNALIKFMSWCVNNQVSLTADYADYYQQTKEARDKADRESGDVSRSGSMYDLVREMKSE